jgi:protein-S-isoprenylcysteine O-methyltransferase Ste14
MLSNTAQKVLAILATLLVCIFVLGLSHSISTGFAGFWLGIPFLIIALAVLVMAWVDVYQETFKSSDNRDNR